MRRQTDQESREDEVLIQETELDLLDVWTGVLPKSIHSFDVAIVCRVMKIHPVFYLKKDTNPHGVS